MTDNENNTAVETPKAEQLSFYSVGFGYTEQTEGTVVVAAKDEETAVKFLTDRVPEAIKDFKINQVTKVDENSEEYKDYSEQFSEAVSETEGAPN